MFTYEVRTDTGNLVDTVQAKTAREALEQIAFNVKMVHYLLLYSKNAGVNIYNAKLKAIKI